MSVNYRIDVAKKNRKLLEGFIDNLSLEQLNKVPQGFKNNVIWNIAHCIVTQQLLVYKKSGLDGMLSDEMIAKYRKGTKTEGDVSQTEVDEIRSLLYTPLDQTNTDYNNGVFKNYEAYTVSTGSTLTKAEEAIDFNNFHEGIHLGYILALKKAL
ncbi:DinB family protein [Winogradskyella immobilis]|uniref:DinB family protein n=1 Tax=Winogradskyella immobilis TaxID=2816852 RepID=A0ABS8ERG9_9FLAO|nr:DinB family protein [Winogradskyella immobilis]MCC1485467.1 DinB family protein [Winogradskyella immobilis]MCG0017559.1 DinB family protein [Winogradskyella immobilis]